MAINHFIPTVWSETLFRQLDKQYIGVANCSRQFEGEIKEKGNVVKICGINNITVSDYSRNTNISAPQNLNDNYRDLLIDQAKYFNFQIDDIDHAQSVPGLMDLALHKAAAALANEADRYVYSLVTDADIWEEITYTTADAMVQAFIDYRMKLMEYNLIDSDELVIEVPPAIAGILLKGKIDLSSSNTEMLENGCIGKLCGCKIFVSNNLYKNDTMEDTVYRCVIRSKRAIAFAEQLSEIEAYRPELRFADAMKGLHLYGAKLVYPEELACIDVHVPLAA